MKINSILLLLPKFKVKNKNSTFKFGKFFINKK